MKPSKKVGAWAIQRVEDGDISDEIFKTRAEATGFMAGLPNAYFRVIEVRIIPLQKKVRRNK